MLLVPIYPILSVLSICLVLIPLPLYWKARNTGTLLYIGWTVAGNAIWTANTIIWKGNMDDPAPIWCDICELAHLHASLGVNAEDRHQDHYWLEHWVYCRLAVHQPQAL
jgi:pheromone a factor receptor